MIRTVGDPADIAVPVQGALRETDPTVAVEMPRTLEQIRRESLSATRFAMQLLVGFGEGARVTVVGVVGGVLASIALARLLGSFLYGVEPNDPLTLPVMGFVVTAITLVASWFPPRRAANVDLIRALGEE